MRKPLRMLLALAGLACQPARAQSPWVTPPNVPTYDYSVATTSSYLHSPQQDVLWGLFSEAAQAGPGKRIYQYRVFSTADNGKTWQQAPKTDASTYNLTALDAQNAWLLREVPLNNTTEIALFRTTSGPTGFARMAVVLPIQFTRVHFFSTTTGIALASAAAGPSTWPIYRTTDGGLTWAAIPNPPASSGGIYQESVNDKQTIGNTLWLSTDKDQLLRTTDQGLTWTTTANAGGAVFESELKGLNFTYTTSGSVSTLHVMRTADGGATWTEIPYSGSPGTVSKTAVAGRPGTYLSYFYMYQGASNWAKGTTRISYDWGSSWQVMDTDIYSGVMDKFVSSYPGQLWSAVRGDYGYGLNTRPMVTRYAGTALGRKSAADPALALAAYPNPTTGQVRLDGPLQGTETVRVYDAAGRLCQQQAVSQAQPTVNLAAQPAGLYQLRITAATGHTRHLRVSKTQ